MTELNIDTVLVNKANQSAKVNMAQTVKGIEKMLADHGIIALANTVHIQNRETQLEDQEDWNLINPAIKHDFSTFPYWLNTEDKEPKGFNKIENILFYYTEIHQSCKN